MGRAPGAVVSEDKARSGWDAWLEDVTDQAQRLVDSAIGHDSDGLVASLRELRHLHDGPRRLPPPSPPPRPPAAAELAPPVAAERADTGALKPPQTPKAAAPTIDLTSAEPGVVEGPRRGVALAPNAAATAQLGAVPPFEDSAHHSGGVAVDEYLRETREMRAVDTRPHRRLESIRGTGDRVFRSSSWLAGLSVLAIMVLVGIFLSLRALSALKTTGLRFLTTSQWQPDVHRFGIAAVLTGTVLIALVAISVAIPIAVGTALFISEVAPRAVKGLLVAMVDLMAAVPSVVYGLWGLFFLQGHVLGLSRWISTWFAWIPIFKVTAADPHNPLASKSVYTASTFIAGLVVALMALPIACSIMREVFSQAPVGEREGAFALGASRWGMIRTVVLPFGKGGMIGASMLALGRALGETIAVYLIISPVFQINFHILQSGSNSVSSLIALRYGDASGFGLSALMAAGLALFVLTLGVNFGASAIVARSRSGAESEA